MNFSIEKKGYNTVEVDLYVEDLEAKYARLQAQNAELEQKLATAKRLIRRFSDTENALKQNIADSKRAAAYMISDANERREQLLDDAREKCGEIISDLDMQIEEKMTTVDLMKAQVSAFRDELFGLYSAHIELIDKLALTAENFEYCPDYTPVAEVVDSFENAEDVAPAVPEFVEYPEESIFAELNEEEVSASDDFVIDNVPEVKEIADEELSFDIDTLEEITETEDFDQLVLDSVDVVTEDGESGEGEVFELDADFSGETLEAEEDDEDVIEYGENKNAESDEDYFKFLADFVNSEDDTNF